VTRASILVSVPLGRAAIAGVGLALLLTHAPAAGARKLQMSGTWAVRIGQVFIPLQFAATTGGVRASLGDLSMGFGFHNGPIQGNGVVTATGSGPATLRFPRHRFQTSPGAELPVWGTGTPQITTMFVVDAPYESATLLPGGGPGSFTWCPNAALGCPAS